MNLVVVLVAVASEQAVEILECDPAGSRWEKLAHQGLGVISIQREVEALEGRELELALTDPDGSEPFAEAKCPIELRI